MLFSQRKEIIMIKFLAEISNVDGDISYPSKLAKFMFEHAPEMLTLIIILACLTICLAVFLFVLFRMYKKDELILRKYKIDVSNEDIDELLKQDKQY